MQKISIITPTYNDGDTLALHIDTFLDQDYESKELILIDDGSKDGSKKIIEKYVKKHPNLIKAIYFKTNKGACVARNEGAKIATGDVYSFLPADSFLPPGLLTIWMKMLKENPSAGFIYGGYTFVDNQINKPSWMGGRIEYQYESQPFDVRELKTANYIDGSFPIRKEVYWGAAKKMGLKDGLWNPRVKSLQDWDFWLSVVIEYGATGMYSNSFFFETTFPHVGGLSADSSQNWLARVRQIQALHGIPKPRLCVSSFAALYHGRGVAKVLDADFSPYPPQKQHDYDGIYLIGGFMNDMETVPSVFMEPSFMPKFSAMRAQGQRNIQYPFARAKRIIHFIGTDVFLLKKMSLEDLAMVRGFLAGCEVLCELPQIQKELASYGINADVVPFPPKKWYDIQPLPKKKSVAVYLPEINQPFYFHDLIVGGEKQKGLIHAMKDVDFHLFGNVNEKVKAKNVKVWGIVAGVENIIKETSAILRLTAHDGLPISVAEWIGAGRNALTTIKIPYADNFSFQDFVKANGSKVEIPKLIKDVERMLRKTLEKPQNLEGAEFYRKWLDADEYKKKIYSYLDYNEKRYWERRAESWNIQAQSDKVKEKKIKEILSSLKFDSVLDVGCGNGRFVPYFEGKEYLGCDISEKLINICKEKYPKRDFYVCSVEDLKKLSNHEHDLVFTYTCLEHVPPENIQKAVDNLKASGKQLLVIEPKDFVPSGDYCFNHDYKKLLKPKKTWKLGNKIAYLV